MANEKPQNKEEKNKNNKSKKEKNKLNIPIKSYLIIFVGSTIFTILISTFYFSNLKKQQIKFMQALSDTTLVDSIYASIIAEGKEVNEVEENLLIDSSLTSVDSVDVDIVEETISTEIAGIDSLGDSTLVEQEILDTTLVAEGVGIPTKEEIVETPKVANVNKTLKILKSMKTTQSVELLSKFDNETVLLFLSKMKERDAAKILAALPSERAFKLTQMMLEKG